ncbi:integrase/recombinase xerD homolog [Mytilus edulis]|uniref:integrase/recombinase xerD homolog n=1 Tax=Mytilus edulis TaxID=6550 RepID=UPI0039EECA39
MSSYLLQSRSDNTNNKYFYAYKRWERFILKQGGLSLPAKPIHVALYLTKLIDTGSSYSVVQSAFYGIKWAHTVRGFSDPTENAFVTNLLESSKRQPHKPKVKKEHIDSESIIELCIKYKDSDDIAILRDLCMIVLSFSGFLRYNELSSLRCKDVHFKTNYLEIDIDKSKTDQYRLGEKLVISNGESAACPYSLLSKYFSICKIESSSEQYLFKPIFRSGKRCSLIYKNKKLSYTRARECIVARLKEVCGDINIGLHSLRAGGATVAANADVNERCWKRHGRYCQRWVRGRLTCTSFRSY